MLQTINEETAMEPPSCTYHDWNDWKWQLINVIKTKNELQKIIKLTKEEKGFFNSNNSQLLPFKITPYFLNVIKQDKSNVLRKTVIPTIHEFNISKDESEDPLNEVHSSKLENIVHRYPDRCLFLVSKSCASYCRYCTRSRIVGKGMCNNYDLENAFKYIREHEELRDIIVSGGDPFILDDIKIEYILSRLREIKHIEIIRIGTKIPVVLPMRITKKLIDIIKRFHPIYINIHFIHPLEITEETSLACEKLVNAGIPLGAQTVLLQGINNDPQTMKELYHKLLKIRVRPAYIYQCDRTPGSSHFVTKVSNGLDIMKQLILNTSGFARPHFVIDSPNGYGKIPLLPDGYIQEMTEKSIILKGLNDNISIYNQIRG